MGGSTLARREPRGEENDGGDGQRGAGIHGVHTKVFEGECLRGRLAEWIKDSCDTKSHNCRYSVEEAGRLIFGKKGRATGQYSREKRI